MCGVIGFFGDYRRNKNTIEKLIEESSIRGTHSFGFSYLSGKVLLTEKRHTLNEIVSVLNVIQPDGFIFHNRYSTTGDYKDHANNQPIQIGNFSIAFNGVISQATREENEASYQMELETTNDAEIFLKTKDKNVFIDSHSGSFAGLYFSDSDAYVFRNSRRPLYFSKGDTGIFIASTYDILSRSGLLESNLVRRNCLVKVSEL